MICKNCKTAIAEDAKKCINCGHDVSKSESKKLAIVLSVTVIVVAVAAFFATDADKYVVSFFNEQPTSLANNTKPTEINETEKPTGAPVNEEVISSNASLEVPSANPNFEMPIDDVWSMVTNVAEAAQYFYDTYSPTIVFVTQNGYLFNVPADSYVKTIDFLELTEMEEKYGDEDVLILYLKTEDLMQFDELDKEHISKDAFSLFAAYETHDGFAIASSSGKCGILTREKLSKLLKSYDVRHGDIVKLGKSNEKSEKIEKAIVDYLKLSSGVDVRFLSANDKYAFAVVSPKGSPDQIRQFVVVNNSGKWSVELSDFEELQNYKEIITESFADFTIALLPPYSMYYHNKYIQKDFTNIIEILKNTDVISEADGEVSFVSGNVDFAYLEFESGKKLLGNYLRAENTWDMNLVETYAEAEELMSSLSSDPPLFLIKQY